MEDNNQATRPSQASTLTEAEVIEATVTSNTYAMTEDEKAQVQAIATEMQALQNEAQVVLKSIARSHKLDGNWTYDPVKFTFTKA